MTPRRGDTAYNHGRRLDTIAIRPIVPVEEIEKVSVTPLTSGASGYSGVNYVLYAPADSGTKSGVWGPVSQNLISVDTATASLIMGDSGASGDFSDTRAVSGMQLIGGTQNILQTEASLSVDVSSIALVPTTAPSQAGGEIINGGGSTRGPSSTSTDPWASLSLGAYDANAIYVLSRLSLGCGSDSNHGSITITSATLELGDAGQNVIASIALPVTATQSSNVDYSRSGNSSIALTTCVIPLVYVGSVAYGRIVHSFTTSETYTAPDLFQTGITASVKKIYPAVANHKVAYRFIGATPTLSTTGSAGSFSDSNAYTLAITAGYRRYLAHVINLDATNFTIAGGFYPSGVTASGGLTSITSSNPEFSSNLTGQSMSMTVGAGYGVGTFTVATNIEEFYHVPIPGQLGTIAYGHVMAQGSISTDRTKGGSDFSSMKWQYDPIDSSTGTKYVTGSLNPPVPSFTLE
jgi:hypothetical protein